MRQVMICHPNIAQSRTEFFADTKRVILSKSKAAELQDFKATLETPSRDAPRTMPTPTTPPPPPPPAALTLTPILTPTLSALESPKPTPTRSPAPGSTPTAENRGARRRFKSPAGGSKRKTKSPLTAVHKLEEMDRLNFRPAHDLLLSWSTKIQTVFVAH